MGPYSSLTRHYKVQPDETTSYPYPQSINVYRVQVSNCVKVLSVVRTKKNAVAVGPKHDPRSFVLLLFIGLSMLLCPSVMAQTTVVIKMSRTNVVVAVDSALT